jgi:LysM domain
MRSSRPSPLPSRQLLRLPLLGAAVTVVTVVLLDGATAAWADLRALPDTSTATPADALADVAVVLALAAWGWLVVGAAVTIVETGCRRPGRALAPRLAPAAWRRLVLSAVGIGVLSAPAAVAQASPGDPPRIVVAAAQRDPGRSPAASVAEAIRGLPLPDRPYGRRAAVPAEPAEPAGGQDERPGSVRRVIVRSGDSLWTIAERQLGPDATALAVSTEWRRWYAANRARIGPDPNLIIPGMVLHAPETKAAS